MLPSRGSPPGRRLLDRVRDALALRHYSPRTADAYVGWIRRFVLFHARRHPSEMGAAEVTAFLSSLAMRGAVSASTQNQALAAILFLYSQVLERDLEFLADVVRAKRPARLPVVMTREEVAAVLSELRGVPFLMASLLYGAGLRLIECVSLRIKDVDFAAHQIAVRQAKGAKDRATLLPVTLTEALQRHVCEVRRQYQADLAAGAGSVALPYALRMKYPNAPWEWPWQWLLPATHLSSRRDGGAAPPSPARDGAPACRPASGAESRHREGCELPFASAIRSPHTFWSPVMTFARFRRCSGTVTCERR
jgi:integron integrase